MDITTLNVIGDSQLVVNHVEDECTTNEDKMKKYLAIAQEMIKGVETY